MRVGNILQPNSTGKSAVVRSHEGWSSRKLRAQLRAHGVTAQQIADSCGLSYCGVRFTILGSRKGLRTRQAIAQALGVAVTTIWPDALLPLRERRGLRRVS